MDFSTVKRVSFATPGTDTEPAVTRARQGLLTRTLRRRMAAIKEAVEALPVIPAAGETLHGIMTGTYDLMHLLIVLLDKLASPALTMRIATLSLSARNVTEMVALIDAGQVQRLDLLCSDFCWHDKDIFAGLLAEFTSRGQRVAAARFHCKIVCIALEDGRRFTLEGSANLRTNSNQEQFALTQDVELHGFYDAWITEMVEKHEVQEASDQE